VLTRREDSMPNAAGAVVSLRVRHPKNLHGIQLPVDGICTKRSVDVILLSTTTSPPVYPTSVSFYKAKVAASSLCSSFTAPVLTATKTVPLGQPIVVHWEAGNDLMPRLSHHHDWVALYHLGDCDEVSSRQPHQSGGGGDPIAQASQEAHFESCRAHHYAMEKLRMTLLLGGLQPTDRAAIESQLNEMQQHLKDYPQLCDPQGSRAPWQHRCYLGSESLPVEQHSGEVHFPIEVYKVAGTYEVRFFRGDSPAGQGMACRALPSITNERIDGDAVHCVLEAAGRSGTVRVVASSESVARAGEWSTLPGMHAWAEMGRDYEGGYIYGHSET